jgi:hypothetical protein
MRIVSMMAHFLLGIVLVVSWIRVAIGGLPLWLYFALWKLTHALEFNSI